MLSADSLLRMLRARGPLVDRTAREKGAKLPPPLSPHMKAFSEFSEAEMSVNFFLGILIKVNPVDPNSKKVWYRLELQATIYRITGTLKLSLKKYSV